jgi:hypothetical protein
MAEFNSSAKITNPLDELFNTLPHDLDEADAYQQTTEGEIAVTPEATPEKDEEDVVIDGKIDQVYDAAMDAFNQQTAYQEVIEPRYAARNAEVAANFLNIALNAAATRARVKGDRKRNSTFVPYANKNPNGAVVATREEIMKLIAVDAETKELK